MKYRKALTLVVLSLVISVIFAFSPSTETNLKSNSELSNNSSYTANLPSGKDLLETKCNMCHSIKESQDKMLAPPFAHIKKKYSKVYKSKSAFVDAITNFTINPKEENAIMYGALKQFKTMPNMSFDKGEVQQIANYIYENNFTEPKWCGK